MTWEEAHQKCTYPIVPACHNTKNTVTISGPKKDVERFVEELTSQGIFAKEVQTSNIAFHSHFMSPVGPSLEDALKKVSHYYLETILMFVSVTLQLQLVLLTLPILERSNDYGKIW